MALSNLDKLNIKYPLQLISNSCIMYNSKCFLIKYSFLKNNNSYNFVDYVKLITNNYYTFFKIFKNIRKSNVTSRNNLSYSTRKPWAQKGLGKARSGSLKSPLWRGGATLFGPVSKKLNIFLQKKIKKLSLFYILLNKRTNILFKLLLPNLHSFNSFEKHLKQQERLNGIFSNKILYVFINNLNFKFNNINFIHIKHLNIMAFLKFDYIIFLI